MKKLPLLLVILASMMLFIGCFAGVVTKEKVTLPNGKGEIIVSHNQLIPDYMIPVRGLALNYIVEGELTDTKLSVIRQVEKAGRSYTKRVRPSSWVSTTVYTLLYIGGGYAGGYYGSSSFQGADRQAYGKYTAIVTGVSALISSFILGAGKTYTFEIFCKEFFILHPEYGITVLMKSPY